MKNITFSQLPISLDKFHPYKEYLHLIPPIILGSFSVHHQIKQTCLEISEYYNQSVKGSSAHYEVVYQLILVQRLVQWYLVQTLLQLWIPEAIELYHFCNIVMSSWCCYMEVNLTVKFIVVVKNRTNWCFEVKINTLIQLKVCQGIHDSTLHTYRIHLDCIFPQLCSHK